MTTTRAASTPGMMRFAMILEGVEASDADCAGSLVDAHVRCAYTTLGGAFVQAGS